MSIRFSQAIVTLLACVLLSAAMACAQDWPQWRGVHRDGAVTGFVPPAAAPTDLTQVWQVPVGSGDATPALVGERIYVFTRQGAEEVILCLNAADGTEIWRDSYPAPEVTGPAARHPGPRSSPVVAEGKVVTLGATGILSCLDAETGAVAWRFETGGVPRFFTASSPMIVDGLVIAQVGSEDNGGIVAYDLTTGEVRWQWTEEGPQYSSPMLMEVEGVRQVVALTAASLVGISLADGALLWRVPFVAQGRSYNAATPVVNGDIVVITGAGRGTRALRIVRQDEGFGVEELWTNSDVGCQFSTPVLEGGLLFGLSAAGTLFCLDAQTGEARWVDATGRDRGGFGAIVNAGSVIVALPSSGELVAFAPAGDAFTELATIRVSQTPTYAHPLIAGNRLFVKGEDTLTLLTMP